MSTQKLRVCDISVSAFYITLHFLTTMPEDILEEDEKAPPALDEGDIALLKTYVSTLYSLDQ
jgi:hypothetical protein